MYVNSLIFYFNRNTTSDKSQSLVLWIKNKEKAKVKKPLHLGMSLVGILYLIS